MNTSKSISFGTLEHSSQTGAGMSWSQVNTTTSAQKLEVMLTASNGKSEEISSYFPQELKCKSFNYLKIP